MTPSSLQVLPELRAEQALRLWLYADDAEAVYFGKKWDLGESEISPSARRLSRWGLVGLLIRQRYKTVEVPEPLWMRELPFTLMFAATVKLRDFVTQHRTDVVFYAIENSELRVLLGQGALPRVSTPAVRLVLGTLFPLMFDRVVFGSPAARDCYLQVAPRLARVSDTELELPPPRELSRTQRWTCAFVGEVSSRKGVVHLMRAWEDVERAVPAASLVVIGGGPLLETVRTWCEESPHSRSAMGLVEAEDVPALLAAVSVLAAPSIRDGRWREQIGLPIKEALSVGVTVVTTDDSGLAPWLSENGHHVIPLAEVDSRLADELVSAISHPLSKEAVRASLPLEDGRVVAHGLLHGQQTHADGDLAAVVVHHRSLSTLPDTLSSIVLAGVAPNRIVVVDNSVGHVSDAELCEAMPTHSILCRTGNQGYAAAVNHGLRTVAQMSPAPGQVLVATHEAQVDAASLSALSKSLDTDARLGAVGPVLETGNGRHWSAGGGLTRVLRLPRHLEVTEPRRGMGVRTVEWLDGALVLYRAQAIKGRALDERYFLYMEEVDFHLSLARSGWRVGICDGARATQASLGMPAFYAARNTQILQQKWGRPGLRWVASLSVMGRGIAHSVISGDRQRRADLIRGYVEGRRVIR